MADDLRGCFRGNSGRDWIKPARQKMTDAVEKGFSGGRTNFFKGAGAVVRK
jgi:hypothetical protein